MKVATLDLTPELFIGFAQACKEGSPRCFIVKENPLPDDAEIVDIFPVAGNRWRLLIHSEAFADLKEGQDPPKVPLVVFQVVHSEVTGIAA